MVAPLPGQRRHTSRSFDKELAGIHKRILRMGGLAVGQAMAVRAAVNEMDTEEAAKIDLRDAELNRLELKIDERCVDILARRHPTAVDLRFVVAMIRSVAQFERIGDEAAGVARYIPLISSAERVFAHIDGINDLAGRAIRQTERAIAGLRHMDSEAAYEIFRAERETDLAYRKHLKRLLSDSPAGHDANDDIFVFNALRAFERIGDHASNLGEEIVFMVTGTDLRHHHQAAG